MNDSCVHRAESASDQLPVIHDQYFISFYEFYSFQIFSLSVSGVLNQKAPTGHPSHQYMTSLPPPQTFVCLMTTIKVSGEEHGWKEKVKNSE